MLFNETIEDALMNASAAALVDREPTETPQEPPKSDGTTAPQVMPQTLFVLDTTAVPHTPQVPGSGSRRHDMIVAVDSGHKIQKSYTFEPGVPLELPLPIAIKFLRIPAFRRTDKDGNVQPYSRQPKQPHELGAGERFELNDHQTVADYSELSNMALLQRALELPGGEALENKDRQSLINFIVKTLVTQRKANAERTAASMAAAAKAADVDADLGDINPIDDEE